MGLFKLSPKLEQQASTAILEKANNKKKPVITLTAGKNISVKIANINAMVEQYLGKYRDDYLIIQTEDELKAYIDDAKRCGKVSIDTETTSLDPITCTLVGICLYVPHRKAAYIPVNHINYITNQRIESQLTLEQVRPHLQRLTFDDMVEIVMFNAKFDIRVLKNQLGLKFKCTWDGYIAARLLNENEDSNRLKDLHKKYCDSDNDKGLMVSDLIDDDFNFSLIPINSAYLYAARDALITYQLYQFQKPYLTRDTDECQGNELQGVCDVFYDIEMPLIDVLVDMEDTGICLDMDYAQELKIKYHKLQDECLQLVYDEVDKFKPQVDEYIKSQRLKCKLSSPINIGSPTQIAILLYDILNITPIEGRGTGEPILQKIDHPICEAILNFRAQAKLTSTYLDKMPEIINSKTGKIHCSFNQIGAGTGRFSSTDPNMQNIPAKNKDIRKMFCASQDNVLISSDFSQQEPRLLAHMSNDEKMIQAYKDKKDIYVEVASLAFNLPYEECMEFRPDGTVNEKGAERRYQIKQIVLAIMYDKGVAATATDLKVSKKKAEEIINRVMIAFPKLEKFREESRKMAKERGYVTTNWGRKRRLPDMQLPLYEFTYLESQSNPNFDPLTFEQIEVEQDVPLDVQKQYIRLLNSAWGKEKEKVKGLAREKGIHIKDNGGFIAEATRQCVNSRIQGSAADQTKIAMILIHNDHYLREQGFKLLLTVHDELIGECPLDNAKAVAERFSFLMCQAGKDLRIPSKCDTTITRCWYGEKVL